MAESIDNYIAEIFQAASSIRDEGVTDRNKRAVSQAISSIAHALSTLQRRIAELEAERARVISPE
jgi:anti-sigma factor RsiW